MFGQHIRDRGALRRRNRETLVQLLRENQTDLAVMGRPPRELDTISEPLAENPNVMVAPVTHRLAKAGRFDIQELRHDTFLQREAGSGTRLMMEEFLRGTCSRRSRSPPWAATKPSSRR